MEKLFCVTDGRAAPAPYVKVLKASDCETLCRVADLLNEARQEAARVAESAQAAYQARWEAGYKDGVEAGKQEHAEKMMETVLASVDFIAKIENTVVDVVNQSIRKIIGDRDDETRIRRIVGTALNNVRGEQKVTVRVAPADEPTVRQALAAMTSSAFLTIVADPRLTKDSCILESELGVIDASLATQLKALEHAFRAKLQA